MLRVYLDQWVWVLLTRAALGRPAHASHVEALEVARDSVARDLASFPISSVHYMELAAGATARQRREITNLIWELSRQHTMVSTGPAILKSEIRQLLSGLCGRPQDPGNFPIFGIGGGHALGMAPVRMRLTFPEGLPYPGDPDERFLIEQWASAMAEWYLLAGPDDSDFIPDYDPRAHRIFNWKFVDEEQAFAQRLARLSKAKRLDAHFARAWVGELWQYLKPIMIENRIDPAVIPDSKEGLTAFLREIPSLWNWTQLKMLQHQNPRRPWEPQDFSDLQALTVAIIHCDIVVFDKHWASMAMRAKLDQRYGTRICRLADLGREIVRMVSDPYNR